MIESIRKDWQLFSRVIAFLVTITIHQCNQFEFISNTERHGAINNLYDHIQNQEKNECRVVNNIHMQTGGFHVDVEFKFELEFQELFDSIDLIIVNHIPYDYFYDSNDIHRSQLNGVIPSYIYKKSCYSNPEEMISDPIDRDLKQYESIGFEILNMTTTSVTTSTSRIDRVMRITFLLPIHYRYHVASEYLSQTTVNMPYSDIFIRLNNHCNHFVSIPTSYPKLQCEKSFLNKTNVMNVKSMDMSSYKFCSPIPQRSVLLPTSTRGNIQIYQLVGYLSMAVIWISTIITVKIIMMNIW